jgi:tetratricopeptide (TPR) repeat protein
MTERTSRPIRSLLFMIAAALASPASGAAQPSIPPPGKEALDWAFRFASAIRSDPKDMGRAQEGVVQDYAFIGAMDEAIKKADLIEDWRKGTALADLAAAHAEAGRSEEARRLIGKAEAVRDKTEGWQGPRIDAHIAQALALLGEVGRSEKLSGELAANDTQYAGQAVATVSSGLAAKGDFEEAMERLDHFAPNGDYEAAWWKATGYLAIAKRDSLTSEQRARALQSARLAADEIPGWKKAEALESIAEEMRAAGQAAKAREALEAAEPELLSVPTTSSVRPALLSNLARTWARLGERDRAQRLIQNAEAGVKDTMITERPIVYANLASSLHAAGDVKGAKGMYQKAFSAASELANARPRALALVAICRTMGRSRMPLDESTRDRLAAFFSGLKAPW